MKIMLLLLLVLLSNVYSVVEDPCWAIVPSGNPEKCNAGIDDDCCKCVPNDDTCEGCEGTACPTDPPTYQPTGSTTDPTGATTIDPTSFPTTAPISYPNCNYKKKYAKTFTGVGRTWTNWYDGKVKLGKNAFLDEYPWCGDASSLEFFYQFVYDESARTLTFYAQFCCGTNKQFGSDYRVTWVPNGFGSKTEYVPNQAWIDHNTPLYDYTCKYKKNYEITLPDTVWPSWQQYCNKWINKGRDAFLDEKPWCGYEDSLEFFYAFSYNSNAKQ
eukprot:210451_1